MLIIGCDFHTRYQQIAMVDNITGELTERRLEHTGQLFQEMPLARAVRSSCNRR